MKTPDEIKKGLCCSVSIPNGCKGCQFEIRSEDGLTWDCTVDAAALAYIRQLESRLAQAERERDALMYDYPIGIECHTCKHETADCYGFPCNDCVEVSRNAHHLMWEWRGVREENTKDGADV